MIDYELLNSLMGYSGVVLFMLFVVLSILASYFFQKLLKCNFDLYDLRLTKQVELYKLHKKVSKYRLKRKTNTYFYKKTLESIKKVNYDLDLITEILEVNIREE